MSAGLNLDALDEASRTSAVVRKGTVKISAHLDAARPSLTLTETRVLQLAAQGLSTESIARQLRCSLTAVNDALIGIYGKLELRGDVDARVAAVLWWVTR